VLSLSKHEKYFFSTLLGCFPSNGQRPPEFLGHLGKSQRVCACSGNNQDILGRGYSSLVRAEKLAQHSFHTVTHHSVAEAAGRGDAKTGPPLLCGSGDHHEVGAVPAFPAVLQQEELPAYQQTRGFG